MDSCPRIQREGGDADPRLRPIVEAMAYPQYPPPDPDGRPSIEIDFNLGGEPPELDLARSVASLVSIEEQQLELSEGLHVVLFEDAGSNGCSSTRSWIGSIRNAMVAGSYASIGRRFAPGQSQAKNEFTDHQEWLVATPMLHAGVSNSSRRRLDIASAFAFLYLRFRHEQDVRLERIATTRRLGARRFLPSC